MGGDAGAECGQIIAALERRDEPPIGMAVGDFEQLLGYPSVIAFLEQELGERIALMRIEPGRDQHEIGPEGVERRQDALRSSPEPELARAGHRAKGTLTILPDPVSLAAPVPGYSGY